MYEYIGGIYFYYSLNIKNARRSIGRVHSHGLGHNFLVSTGERGEIYTENAKFIWLKNTVGNAVIRGKKEEKGRFGTKGRLNGDQNASIN